MWRRPDIRRRVLAGEKMQPARLDRIDRDGARDHPKGSFISYDSMLKCLLAYSFCSGSSIIQSPRSKRLEHVKSAKEHGEPA